jgi:hypothetical protein
MKKKIILLVTLNLIGTLLTFNSYASMERKDTTALFLFNEEWKKASISTLYQEGLSNGWYEENGNWFYIINGSPISSSKIIDDKRYFFNEDGTLMVEDTEPYNKYILLLDEMHEAKLRKDSSWKYDCSSMSEYQRYKLLCDYSETYMYNVSDLAETGFQFVGNDLVLDPLSKFYATENLAIDFFSKIKIKSDMSDERKVRIIHDSIINNFSYDESLKNMSYELGDGLRNNNKIVCAGYAGIFKTVCDRFGIEAEVITGIGKGEGHAWNRVKINGDWKYIDCTWDDTLDSINWFLKTKEIFDRDHKEF